MFYCEECRIKNKWPEAFSRSHGKCECCDTVTRCHDRPSSTLPPVRRTPAPASTGCGIAEEMCSTMMGVAELKLKMAKSKEQVEAALEISGARELDVEAERDQFSQWHLEKFGYKPSDGEAYGHPFDIWLAARNASPTTVDTVNTSSERVQNAQGKRHVESAPVSTEQAGDAWISVEDRLPEKECLAAYSTPNGKVRLIRAKYARKFQIEAEDDDCETEYNEDDDTFYIKEGWLECIDNWGEYSSCYVVEGIVTHWMPLPAAPSPNNSRVGADKEPK